MPRELSADELTVIQGKTINLALFAVFEWPSGTARAWSGIGDFTWGGETFKGLGDLSEVSPIEESSDGRAGGITLSLSGVPTEIVATVLSEHYQNRWARLYLGLLDHTGALIQDPPREIFAGKMNVASDSDDGTTSKVSISVDSRMIILQQASTRRYTHEDQQIDYPGDLGFEYVVAVNREMVDNWGAPGAPILTRDYGQSRQAI